MKVNKLDFVTVITFTIVVVLILYAILTPGDGNRCDGKDYDYGACLVQKMEDCLATEQFTREECITLVSGGKSIGR